MSITILIATCGFMAGFAVAAMWAAVGRKNDAAALADAQAEIVLLRRRLAAQANENELDTSRGTWIDLSICPAAQANELDTATSFPADVVEWGELRR